MRVYCIELYDIFLKFIPKIIRMKIYFITQKKLISLTCTTPFQINW